MQPSAVRTALVRIGLVLAILAGLAVTILNLSQLKQRITNLQLNLATQTAARQRAEADLARTRTELSSTTATLKETRASLAAAVTEKQKALAQAAAQAERAGKLNTELIQTRNERDEAREGLAQYKAAGMEPDQIVAAAKAVKSLQDTLAVLQEENKVLARRMKRLAEIGAGGPEPVMLPAGFKAHVVAIDPKWHFVVLDAGENQGVLARAELLVSRNGKLLAKARVSSLQKDRCVANLVAGWEFGEVVEGDIVTPANPES